MKKLFQSTDLLFCLSFDHFKEIYRAFLPTVVI